MALDGNTIGGLLLEIFAVEMTSAEATCASCGAVGPSQKPRFTSGGRERSSAAADAPACLWSSRRSAG